MRSVYAGWWYEFAIDMSLTKTVDQIVMKVDKRYGNEAIMQWSPSIPLPCRIVAFTWAATGYALCEGYVMFLCMQCEHRQLAFCFRSLGLDNLAETMDRMLSPIRDDGVLGNTEALEARFGGWDNLTEWVGRYEPILFKANDSIDEAIFAYYQVHLSDFRL